MRILKFGGSSVATGERRAAVAGIVLRAAADGPVAVVTSALAGVTDLLSSALAHALAGQVVPDLLTELVRLHAASPEASADPEVRAAVVPRLGELRDLVDGVALLGDCPPAVRHRVLASGERLALPLLVAALRRRGIPAVGVDGTELVVTDDAHGAVTEPALDLAATWQRVRSHPALRGDAVPVVTGFVAADVRGRTTTLGRGASDLTATLLAAGTDASAVEIWSDVDGVLDAPPSLVPAARPLERLSYGEAAGLAHFGAKVLHPRTLEPVARSGVPVWIKNTLRPEAPGTRVDASPPSDGVKAIAAVPSASRLVVRAAWGVPRHLSRAFAVLERLGTRPILTARGASADVLEWVVATPEADLVEAELRRELGPVVERRDGLAVVAAVGGGTSRGAEALRLLEAEGIEPLSVAFLGGPEPRTPDGEHAVAALVDGIAAAPAATLLHGALVGGRQPPPPRVEEAQPSVRPLPWG